MKIQIIPAYEYAQDIAELFSEYTAMLIEGDKSFAGYLKLQNYDDEINDLKSKYGEPTGRLYLALCGGKAAGCIALKKIDSQNCELKRLYVRPEYRGRSLGKLLVQKIIEDAKKMGYRYIYLDTLPFLETAIKLYKNLGFYEIEKYNNSPMQNAIYMRLDLKTISY